jgi:hypothetical protein
MPIPLKAVVSVSESNWINNTTYCNGQDSVCTSDLIVTVPEIRLSSPGVVRHDYPFTEAPIVPQVPRQELLHPFVDKHLIQFVYVN